MACNIGLLSLPDEILARIAEFTHNYCERHNELKYWARAASLCKRLSEVQLCSGQAIHNCRSEASNILHPGCTLTLGYFAVGTSKVSCS